MKKNQYRKPYMAIEQFAPNEYVADCWYVAVGDCYDDLYADMYNRNRHEYNNGEHIVQNHGSHRIPTTGYFNSETQSIPVPLGDYEYYINIGDNVPWEEQDYIVGPYQQSCDYEEVKPLKFEYNGEPHYLKQISYSTNRNQS